MDDAAKKAFLLSVHDEKLNDNCEHGAHVLQVWNDGEITSTKGGELFLQRTLHLLNPGNANKAWSPDLFPKKNWRGFGYVFVTSENAERVHEAILEG